MATEAKEKRTIVTPECILSYPHLFVPRAMEDGKPEEYSCAPVFLAGTNLDELKMKAIAVAKARWGDKAVAMIRSGQLRMPFRKGEEKGYPEGSTFFNVRSRKEYPPVVISRYRDPDTLKPIVITDHTKVYPGVVARLSLTPFAYDTKGNKGVSFGLNVVQIIRDGPRIDGRVNIEDEFTFDEPAVAALDDLTTEAGGTVEPEKEAEAALDLAALLG